MGASDTAVAVADARTSLSGEKPGIGNKLGSMETPVAGTPSLSLSDMVGITLSGRYLVKRKLGQGGMGAVYEATHTLIGKRVAVKVLLEKYARREAIVQRLEQEARLASSCQNEHIIDITDFGTTNDGRTFVVMEYLEGESLAECLAREIKLPEQRILRIVSQAASALVAAHAKGIVHRDIKPENLFLLRRKDQDFVKVVDFGISKSLRASDDADDQPRLTQTGMVLGTPLYMSPEQARGDELDARTDLFSFGVVLYEMATGAQPFQGATTAVIFDAILNKTPLSLVRLRPDLPAGLELIINKALEKDREVRCQTASELRVDLKRLKRDTGPGKTAAAADTVPTPKNRRQPLLIAGVLAGVLIVIGIASAVARFALRQPPAPPELLGRRLTANPAENVVNSAVISPDGKYVAYSDLGGIHLKLIKTGENRTIPQTEGWSVTSWFPDGSKLLASGPNVENPGVWAISVLGGTQRKLHDHGSSGIVAPDGSQIAFGGDRFGLPGSFREIWVMGPGGEEPRKIFTVKEADLILQPAWSPDSRRIAYLRLSLPANFAAIESFDLSARKVTTLLPDPQLRSTPGGSGFCWTLDGRIIYSRQEPPPNAPDSNLWELRVNSNTGEPAGKPRKITHWSGTTVLSANAGADGRRLAVLKANFQMDVYIGQLEANGTRMKAPRRLTLDERNDYPGPWMPDSKTEIFSSERNGNWDIFKQAIDQPSAEPLVTGPDDETAKAVTPDGLWLVYTVQKHGDASAPVKVMRVPMSGGSPELLLDPGVDFYDITCAKRLPSTLCVVASLYQKGMVFSTFDLSTRQSRELAKVEHFRDWDLFHDGSRIAVLIKDQGKSSIRIVRSSGETEREFTVERAGIRFVFCSADGKGLYLVATPQPRVSELYYTDLRGQARVLWQQKGRLGLFIVQPSPDGRYLALMGATETSDAWLLENF